MRGERVLSILTIIVLVFLSACSVAPAAAVSGAAGAVAVAAAPTTAATATPTPAASNDVKPTAVPRPLPPTIVSTQPGRGEEQLVSAPVVVTFDQPMDPASTSAAFQIEPEVPGEVTVEDNSLTFTPTEDLERGQEYRVTLAAEATAANGLALQQPVSFRFVTAGFLQVTNTQPTDGAESVTVDTPIVVAFNRPVVPLGGGDALPQPLVITPTVTGAGEWINTSTYQFTPENGLAASTQYTVTVPAGLTDTSGGLLAEDVTFAFRTTDPVIVGWQPENNTNVRIERPISVTFSMPMDQASTEAAFSLIAVQGDTVAGTFSWNADSTEVAFKPSQVLEFGTKYKAAVATTAQSANGQGTLRDNHQLAFAFQTVPLPMVKSTEPRNGNTAASPDTVVRIDFAGPMNPASFMTDTITILPKPTRVYTWYNEFESQLFLDFYRAPATDYTVTLASKVADLYGNTLGEDYVLKFRTRNLDPMLQLNNQGIVGTYSAYTETQAVVAYRNMPEVRFDLYTVTANEFISVTGREFWGNWENYRPPADARVREWAVPTKAAVNRLGYIREPLVDEAGEQLAPGVYWLEVTGVELPNGQRPPRQLIVRTDLNVTIKASETEVLAWVTDLKSGQPVAGATVRVADSGPNDVTGTTDEDGVARIQLKTARKVWEGIVAIASTDEGAFGAASVNWYDGVASWDFNVPGGATVDPYVGYVYTDRPIYRPGQTVYWKAIIRRNQDVQYTLPTEGQELTLTINDQVGNTLVQQQVTLDALGTVSGQLDLGPDATLGYYYVYLRLTLPNKEEANFGIGFQVAEYRKPEYELSAQTDKPEYIQGEQIRATAQANYFFGGPVKNARVKWTALAYDNTFTYQGEGYYSFSDWEWWNTLRGGVWGGQVSQGEGRTDDQGRFTFTLPADITKYAASQRFTFDISVFDLNNQVVSTQTSAVIHKGEFYIGVKPASYVSNAGEESQVDVLTVDPQSQPVADVDVDLVVSQVEWRSVREQAEDGQFYWVTRPKYTPVVTETVTTDTNGVAALKWTPEQPGEYKVTANARDSKGHAIRSAAYIWVSGESYVAWRQENNDRIKLVADKDEYKVGDTAEILISSPYQGTVKALVTLERGRILTHQVFDLTSNSQVLRIPIIEEHVPNVFLSIVIMKGIDETNPRPSFKMGMLPLKVSTTEKALQVILTPRSATASAAATTNEAGEPLRLAPRSKVTWEVKTLDAAGKPVAADVSLALVDKAVLTLAQDQSGKILDRFYAQRGLSVLTGVTLALNVDRLVAQLADAGKGGGGGGGDGGLTEVRTDFPDIAYWRASVATNAEGVATVEVTLPDNLTTWVMDARAATETTLVGQNTVEVIATKDLLVRPVLPRFFVAGDQAEIAGIIHNTTANDLDVEISLAVTGLDVTGEGTSTATVPAGGTYKATWPVSVQADAGEVKVRMTANAATAKLSDAVEITLPVQRYSTPEVVGTSGQVETGTEALELVRLPVGIDTTRGDLTVNIEPSLAAGMLGGLTYLEHFPYECIEQTMSRFLPNVITFQALKELGIERPDLDAKLPQQVGVGLQRIYARQHLDGGWGWWEKDASNPAVSAYVVFGLAKAQQAGFTVDANVLDRAVQYLRDSLTAADELKNWELNRQAFSVYALAEAGRPEPNRAGALYEQRERMDNFGKAYLALALGLINDEAAPERIKTLLADLYGSAITTATSTHWEEAQPDYWNMNTNTRSTAVILAALAQLEPEPTPLAANAVRWLMSARKADAWETTQETAWAIIGLTKWMAATGELQGNYGWQVQLNDQPLGQGDVTPETVQDVTALQADITQLLLDQTNALTISRTADAGQTGAGQLYYTAFLRTYQPVEQVKPLNRGFTVTREYRMAECVDAQKTALQLLPDCPTVTKAKVGDVLQVRVTLVVPHSSYYVVVEDPLPAGTEAIDTSLRITSQTAQGPQMEQQPEQGKEPGWNWWWTPTHVELRDEKAVLFATDLQAGTYIFVYQVRATLPGTFLTLPVTASQMYFPEVWGRGAGSTFVVTE